MIPEMKYEKDNEIVYAKGFATDIGETCAWITGLARDGIQRL